MGERIQKVLFPARKKRVQFSSERSLHASKLPGNIGRQGSSILRFVGFTSNLFFKRPLGSARASKPRAPVAVNLGYRSGKYARTRNAAEFANARSGARAPPSPAEPDAGRASLEIPVPQH